MKKACHSERSSAAFSQKSVILSLRRISDFPRAEAVRSFGRVHAPHRVPPRKVRDSSTAFPPAFPPGTPLRMTGFPALSETEPLPAIHPHTTIKLTALDHAPGPLPLMPRTRTDTFFADGTGSSDYSEEEKGWDSSFHADPVGCQNWHCPHFAGRKIRDLGFSRRACGTERLRAISLGA